jgi:hypothetical protein
VTTLAYTDKIRSALRRVGLTPEAVVDILGSCLDTERVFLVGSLAAGLGNADSDVDLHVFVTESAPGLVPMLFFANRIRLDLLRYEAGAPAAALAKTPRPSVPMLGARCALGALPGMTDLKRLSRWATAVPMHEDTVPLFDEAEMARVSAALVRLAVDGTVWAAALASVMQAGRSAYAPLAWSRAAEAALEVVVRAAGEIFVGDKWLPTKARRCGLPPSLLAAARRVGSATEYARFVDKIGVPTANPSELVRLCPTDAPQFTFGSRTFRLIDGRLLPPLEPPLDSLERALDKVGGMAVAEALMTRAMSISVDPDAIDRRLQ